MSEKRPLVTFFVIACDFEKFIREAVEAAFAQTYSPLEIILSDDCSKDGTYEIMRQLASKYRGPHAVRLNRFDKRQGFGAHISHLFQMAKGELHIISSGDDVSLPERTEIVVRAWNASGNRANLIYSRFLLVDEHGAKLPGDHANSAAVWETLLKSATNTFDFSGQPIRWVEHRPEAFDFAGRKVEVRVPGCANASSARLFRTFGPLQPDLVFEDIALVFRSILVGSMVFVDKPLVKYRRHGLNLSTLGSAGDTERRQLQLYKWNIITFNQFARDIEGAATKGLVPGPVWREIDHEIARQRKIHEVKCECLTASPWRIPELTCKLLHSGAGPRTIAAELTRIARRPFVTARA